MLQVQQNGTAQAWVVLDPDNRITFRLLFGTESLAWDTTTHQTEREIDGLKAEGWRVKRVTITVDIEGTEADPCSS